MWNLDIVCVFIFFNGAFRFIASLPLDWVESLHHFMLVIFWRVWTASPPPRLQTKEPQMREGCEISPMILERVHASYEANLADIEFLGALFHITYQSRHVQISEG